MSDTLVMVLTALMALATPVWTVWGMWRVTRHAPTRQRALSHVLASITGTSLLGLVLPAALMGALDPVLVWIGYAVLTVASACVLAWRWPALRPGRWTQPGLVASSCVLLVVLVLSAFAVT